MVLDERPSCFRNALHEILFIIVVSSGHFLCDAASGNILVPLNIIGPDMGILNPAELPWTLAAYCLTVGIFIMITGRLGDIYGHKLLFIMGFVIFAVFSAFTGLGAYVKNSVYFDIMRAFQGIGPATILPNAVALLARAYRPGKRKSFAFGIFGAIVPFGFLMGALFGSIFAQLSWWPWGQWVLAFVCLFIAMIAIIIIPRELTPPVHPKGKTDILGAIVGVSGLTLFIYAWNEGPVVGWDKPYVFVLLIVSVFVIGLFIIIELIVEEPIMPLSLWTAKGYPGVLGSIALGWAGFGIYVYYNVQILQVLRHATPLSTTAMLTPVVVSGILATIFFGLVYDHIRPYYLLVGSMACFCIACILVATMPVEQTYWAQEFVATIIAPIGADISFPAATLIVSNTVPIYQQGVAASMVTTAMNWSIAFGLGIAGTITSELLKKRHTLLEGYRGGLYLAIGLTGAATLVALLFCRTTPSPQNNSKINKPSKLRGPTTTTTTKATIIQTGFTKNKGLPVKYPTLHRY